MLKSVAHSIAPSVTRLLNQSIQSGCFPVLWKVSNIVPIPKTGDKSNPSNYRPISLLSILSKILEKHVARLLTSQIKDKSLISDSQWGFLSGRSTTSALLCVIDTWQRHLDSGTEMCSVFLDLQKAFDTVPHRNLLLVLKQMEFHPTLLKWICSYLTSRVQRVVVMVQHHLRFMLFLEFLKDQFSDHCSSSFTLTVLLTCRSLLRQISHSMLTTSYFTNRSETVMILHFCKLISTTYLTGQLEVVYLSTQPNVNLWLSQGKETWQFHQL